MEMVVLSKSFEALAAWLKSSVGHKKSTG